MAPVVDFSGGKAIHSNGGAFSFVLPTKVFAVLALIQPKAALFDIANMHDR